MSQVMDLLVAKNHSIFKKGLVRVRDLVINGSVAKWLRCSVSNLPVLGTTNHKPTVKPAVHPSKVGK